MTHYWLYLESSADEGVKVHVLELLGCFCRRPSQEAALEATPQKIEAYLRFLRLHGEYVPGSEAAIEVKVAEHLTEPEKGAPGFLFQAELAPLDKAELEKYLAWLDWSHQDLVGLVEGLQAEQLDAQPPAPGRTLREILRHVWESERWYVEKVTTFPSIPEEQDSLTRLSWVHMAAIDALRGLSSEARNRIVPGPGAAGASWNVRKVLRYMLEHRWEHIQEIRSRLMDQIR
jgi:uncharacterized damage-inducible protein DinB/predicted RNase H-like HicB family nuclease